MGEPVRIIDLARAMIELSGLDPDRDIDIEIVGARPGEKLHEELFNSYERRRATAAEKILLAEREPLAIDAVESMFDEIGLLVLEGDAAGLAAKVSELAAARRDAPPEEPGGQDAADGGDGSGERGRALGEHGAAELMATIGRPASSRTAARRLRPSYTPRIHDLSAVRALALEHVHQDRRNRRLRGAGRHRGTVAARVLPGARAQAPA